MESQDAHKHEVMEMLVARAKSFAKGVARMLQGCESFRECSSKQWHCASLREKKNGEKVQDRIQEAEEVRRT